MKKTTALEMYMESIRLSLQIDSFKERQIRLAIAKSLFSDDAEKAIGDLYGLKIEHGATSDEGDYLVMVGSIIHEFIDRLTEMEEAHTDRYLNNNNGTGN